MHNELTDALLSLGLSQEEVSQLLVKMQKDLNELILTAIAAQLPQEKLSDYLELIRSSDANFENAVTDLCAKNGVDVKETWKKVVVNYFGNFWNNFAKNMPSEDVEKFKQNLNAYIEKSGNADTYAKVFDVLVR